MTVRIETMGVLVPGHVVRRRDGDDTVLTLTRDQAEALYTSLDTVVKMFQAAQA